MCFGAGMWELFRGDDVDEANVGLFGQQVRSDLGEGTGDLTVEVSLAALVGFEGVEDAISGVADLEGVPRHGPRLGRRQGPTILEEGAQLSALVRLGFKEGEYP